MLRFRHARSEQTVDGADGVTLTFADSGFYWTTSLGGGGFTYHRPVLVGLPDSGVVIPIRDHVMEVRLAAAVMLLLAGIWRWLDGK
ncbi:MAG: hypothetical protein ABWZ58_06370 [Acidimicrobiia bacterium]